MTPAGMRIKLAETPAEWSGAVAVRLAVFVDEQQVPLTSEMDEHDRSAVHAIALLASADGTAATPNWDAVVDSAAALEPARSGTALRAAAQAGKYLPLSLSGARTSTTAAIVLAPVIGTGRLLRAAGGVARIGRIAVLPAWRSQGVGSRLLRLLEEAALARGARQVLLHAQLHALSFYLEKGYTAAEPQRPFQEDGIPHLRLTKPLSPDM
ncbi:MAG: GNAT family N-acetyltransferase [Chloroflexota bacterium]|nr:GNAT family N-acetyltransferase [Chloroflexota bacterium]